MDSLDDIMKARKIVTPDEVTAIKNYILNTYDEDCTVMMERDKIILKLPGSALAATVQLERQKLIKACDLGSKQLIIRNGS